MVFSADCLEVFLFICTGSHKIAEVVPHLIGSPVFKHVQKFVLRLSDDFFDLDHLSDLLLPESSLLTNRQRPASCLHNRNREPARRPQGD